MGSKTRPERVSFVACEPLLKEAFYLAFCGVPAEPKFIADDLTRLTIKQIFNDENAAH